MQNVLKLIVHMKRVMTVMSHQNIDRMCIRSVRVHSSTVMDILGVLWGQGSVSHSISMRESVHCRRSQDIPLASRYSYIAMDYTSGKVPNKYSILTFGTQFFMKSLPIISVTYLHKSILPFPVLKKSIRIFIKYTYTKVSFLAFKGYHEGRGIELTPPTAIQFMDEASCTRLCPLVRVDNIKKISTYFHGTESYLLTYTFCV